MNFTLLAILVLSISIFSFYFSIYRIKTSEKTSLSHRPLHSYYGWYSLFCTLFPALLSFCVWTFCANIWIYKSIIDKSFWKKIDKKMVNSLKLEFLMTILRIIPYKLYFYLWKKIGNF